MGCFVAVNGWLFVPWRSPCRLPCLDPGFLDPRPRVGDWTSGRRFRLYLTYLLLRRRPIGWLGDRPLGKSRTQGWNFKGGDVRRSPLLSFRSSGAICRKQRHGSDTADISLQRIWLVPRPSRSNFFIRNAEPVARASAGAVLSDWKPRCLYDRPNGCGTYQ